VSVQPVLPDIQEEVVVLTGKELVVQLTSRGAAVRQVELVNYASPFNHEERLKLLSPPEGVGALQVMDVTGQVPLGETVYQVQERSDTEVVMEAAWTDGLRLRKTFRLDPTRFHVDVELQLTNTSASPLTLTYLVVGSPGLHPETRKASDLAAKVCLNRTSVSVLLAGSLAKGPRVYPGAELTWIAGTNQYFAAVLAPQKTVPAAAVLLPAAKADLLRALAGYLVGPQANPEQAKQLARSAGATGQALTALVSPPVELQPGASVTHSYLFFCGPQEQEVLSSYQPEGLPSLVSFGMFSPLASVILFILKGFYKVTRSYGLAIILLTTLIKGALLPLSLKGQASMQRMQQLQPKIKELQERHKDDKQKLAQEQMRLWREQGVSPFGGCLPTLIQIPVFIALYRALQSSFDLRQRAFLWIRDLSQPDALFTFPFSLPIIGSNTFNLLPILWMISIVVSQKMMPKPKVQDPQMKQQQTMMTIMPLMFGVLFYGLPAGLLLYFVTQSVLTIGEQKFIRRQLDKLSASPPQTKPAKRPEGTSGKPGRRLR
jgi:YidC/Oxa1 family membrane protein insertase